MAQQNKIIEGAKKIYSDIVQHLTNDGRINTESLLLITSGLAGMSCQMAVRKIAEQKNFPVKSVLMEIGCQNGTRYYMGDNLNYFLLEGSQSVWNMTVTFCHQFFPEISAPDMNQYAAECVKHLGDENYQLWGYIPENQEILILKELWTNYFPDVKLSCETPENMPLLFGIVMQAAFMDIAEVMGTETCLSMALENLLLSAKLDYQA
ncbi:MAG: hypothetical protein IJ642_11430 [Oscillospiraceae bacterium]|nr:hypothetical protein [Oscillospiraceae bacterium]